MTTQTPPRWDLTNVYPSLSSKEFAADFEQLNFLITEIDGLPDQIKILIWDASGTIYNTAGLVNLGGGAITLH